MSWVKLVILLLQVSQSILRMLNERRWIAEGERRQIERELQAVARAAQIAKDVKTDVDKKTDAQVDTDLGPDYRD